MERMVLKHLTGSKANQVEEFPLSHIKELVLGRDPSATVKYDPDRDDLVGRQHARIAQDPNAPTQFIITDLNSRNGTFVNRQKLSGPVRLNHGDVVQLGPGGPEFAFHIEPPPADATKMTRVAEAMTPGAPATRIANTPAASTPPPSFTPPTAQASFGGPSPGGVGKATVERMISHNVTQAKKSQSRTYLLVGGAALVAVVLLFAGVGGFMLWRTRSAASSEIGGLKKSLDDAKAGSGLSATEIANQTGSAVVKIDAAWRLVSPEGDGNVYHQLYKDPKSGRQLALYLEFPDGTIEPALTYAHNPDSYAIGGMLSGTGFSVTNDGYILTNRHVAAAWETAFNFPQRAFPGVVINATTSQVRLMQQHEIPMRWVPAQTKQAKIRFEGRNDSLYVTFPKQDSRILAKLNRVSPRHDVALIKIDMPGTVPRVEINDNYDSIKQGDDVVVLGYPGVSPPVYGLVKSQDVFNRETRVTEIPDPTFSKGNIGRILRGEEKAGGSGDKDTFSHIGDAYQLTINSTGSGNSGGPVLDSNGRVIGIFYAGNRGGDAQITFAVPVRYGRELMRVGSGGQ